MREVYINRIEKFLPNRPVTNDEMEDYLGKINGIKSKARALILRNNGIKTRYYALKKDGTSTHNNAEITLNAIRKLFDKQFTDNDIELLSLGTSSPDQMIPAHAQMVQGLMKNRTLEAISPVGTCNSGILALKYAYLSLKSGEVKNAVAGGSEKLSSWMRANNFKDESEKLMALKNSPYIAFDRDFLRWMLSDGAGVALLQDKPNSDNISLHIDWIDIISYSNELGTCMYAGGIPDGNGQLIPWRDLSKEDIKRHSAMALAQDVRLLSENIIEYGAKALKRVVEKYNFSTKDLDYFLPHMSSEFFRKKISEETQKVGCPIDEAIWFTNLTKLGNVGAASAFLMLEELFHSGKLKKGEKILIMNPESARFSYAYVMLTVV
jgi:3-oxoacyl-[acyl-carrier-protein] synthase-3